MSNSESCPDIFINIDKYLEFDIKLDALEITYEDILRCSNHIGDNIIMYIFRSISIDNDDLAIDLLNKIIYIIKTNPTTTNNTKYNEVLKEIFNKTDTNNNNWLQILCSRLDHKYINSSSRPRNIKSTIVILTPEIKKYIPLTNIDNINTSGENALLIACTNIYLNNISLKYSKLVKFEYQQQITDVCSYVDLEKNKTVKGRYIVNLYSGTTKISSTIFNYN
jgi:hypothetical protein